MTFTQLRSAVSRTLKPLVRWFHHAYANLNGYFWLPCDLCGEWHGGHEWHHTNVGLITDRPGIRRGICDACAEKIMARHPRGAVIDVDPATLKETVTAWTYTPNMKVSGPEAAAKGSQ